MVAAHVYAAAFGLASVGKLDIICTLIFSLFIQNICTNPLYSRQDILDIGVHVGSLDTPIDARDDLVRLATGSLGLFTLPPRTRRLRRRRRDRRQKRGCRGGTREKLTQAPHRTPLPSFLLSNVRSLVHKMDDLRLWIINNKRIMDINILIFTETWLHEGVLDSAIALQGLHCTHSDRTADCGKMHGGGLCIYVNNSWCTDNSTIARHCSADLEFLMVKSRAFYLPREFTSITIAAYITGC